MFSYFVSELLDIAAKKYPTGSLYYYLGGYVHRKRGQLDDAVATFERAHAGGSDLRALQLACLYEMGWCHFLRLDFDAAIDHLQRFLDEHRVSFTIG